MVAVPKRQSFEASVFERQSFVESALRQALLFRAYDTTEARNNMCALLRYAGPEFVWTIHVAKDGASFFVQRFYPKVSELKRFWLHHQVDPKIKEGVSVSRVDSFDYTSPGSFSDLWISEFIPRG
jgi:hypothetical protein